MATNPQTYSVDVIFEDGTQHTYDNVPEGVTSDEVYQRAQRDFKDKFVEELFRRPIAGQAQPAPSPRTAPAPKVQAETPVSSPTVTMEPTTNDMGLPAFEPRGPIVAPKPRAEDYEFGMDKFLDFSPELKGLTKPQEAISLNMMNNPNVPIEEIEKYTASLGFVFTPEQRAIVEEARKNKTPIVGFTGETPFDGMADEEAIKAEYAPQSDNVFAQVGRSIMDSYSNPASLMNFLDRSKLDFFNFYGDELKARFPDATPEELEQLEEQYIGYMARMRGQAAAEGVKNDDFIPWLFGQFIALEPTDALIPARAARAATKAGRILEKMAEGALVGAGTDLAGQALAMGDYAQDELDPVSLAASAGLSGALGNVGQRIDEAFNPAPASFEQGPRIEAPTARRNSKKYNEQLVAANDVVTERATTIANNWTNPPASVRVEPNFKNEGGIDDDALGVYTADGEVVLNTEAIISYAKRRNITPEQMTEGVLFHEALGHHGLTQTFGDQLDEVLDVLYTEGKAEFRDKVDQWIARNPDAYPSPNNAEAIDPVWQRIRATEEVLANMAEDGLIDRSLLDRLIDFIKRTARQVGLDKLAQRLDEDIGKYSTREIRGILAVSQRNVTSGDPSNFKPGFVKNKIVYHGSGADFNKFDHSKMGSGEGQQIFGWGTYLTDVENIAKSYKEKLSRQDVSFGGRRGRIWEVRDIAMNKAEELGIEYSVADAAFTVKSQYYPNKDITGRTVYDDYMATPDDPDWEQMSQEFRDTLDEAAKFVNDNYKVDYSGKLYEVDIPDDAKWLEWEQPLSEQPELRKALEEDGFLTTEYLQDPDANGEAVYTALADEYGSQGASQWLASKGFTGNRYLANNISRRKSRTGTNQDKFNYVVFDDNTPKIVNKYMKPSDTTSAGFKRTKMDERSANEARKQFWKNKDNPDWDSSDPNGLSAKVRRADRYMRGDAVDPETMDADDLIYSEDAAGLLDRILDYNPTAVDISAIEQDLISRGVPPSSVTRLAKTNPGDLVRRRMRYDIAAMKLNDRVLAIQEDIRINGLTEEKQLEYLKADSALKDIATAIFDLDSEFGRSLNLLKKMSMTRRKATNIREFLREADAGEALADPETFMNYMAKRQEAIKADKAKNTNSIAYDVFGAPRAIMSSYDLSAPMRQGISLIGTTQYWKSFFKMFTFIGPSGKENYNWLMKTIARHPNYELMLKARLAFSDVDGKFATREEDFRSDLAKKIPGVSLSEQAYAGFLNKLRADTFNKMVELIREPDGTVSDAALVDLGKFINSATGRAELSKDLGAFSIRGKKIHEGVNLQSASQLLNTAFFSPRLIASRFNMINPVFYYKLDPRIRKQAIFESVKAGGIVLAATMLLGSMSPGAEVELDPRSSDFMKIKVDDTRFDLMGGFSQYLTFAARTYLAMQNALVGGMVGYTPEVKTTTGRLRDLDGRGVYGQTYADIFTRFFRGKLSPNVSYVWDAFDGENVVGEEFNVVNSAYDRMLPMAMSSLFENVEQHGLEKGLRYAAPNVFGISVNTFVPEERNPNQSIESPDEFEGAKLDRAARDWWESRENALFKTYVINYTGETGFEWKDLPPRSQEKIIEWAREDAREMVREQAKIELMEKSE